MLIIDDDLVSREVMATILSMSGYVVHAAADGAQSLALLDAGTCAPEVILMDTQMPGLSGVRLIEELRNRCGAALYAMSGSDAPADVKAQSDGFLHKPFGAEALQRMLMQHEPPLQVLPTSEAPVLSPRILAQFREMMPETAVQEIYTAVMEDLDGRARLLQSAIAEADGEAVRRIGHSIKGGCGMAGALEIARLGELLEAESNQLDNSRHLLVQLHSAMHNLRRMLEAEFPMQGIRPVV